MAVHIFDTQTGNLYSSAQTDLSVVEAQKAGLVADDETLAKRGLAAISGPDLDSTHAWDAATKSVIEVEAKVPPFMISVGIWILRFTPDEFAQIGNSDDLRVKWLMYALNNAEDGNGRRVINLTGSTVKDGVAYMVSLGLLNQDRVAAILAVD